jgi:hypothetical protein
MGNWKVLTGSAEVVAARLQEHVAAGWRAKGVMTRAHASSNIWAQIVIRPEKS